MKYFSKLLAGYIVLLSSVAALAQEANSFIQFDKVEETYELYMSHGQPKAKVTKKYVFARSNYFPTAHMNIYFDDNVEYSYKSRPEVTRVHEEKMVYSKSILHNDLKVRTLDITINDTHRKKYRKVKTNLAYKDATYLTSVFLNEDYAAKSKVVKIVIPKNMPDVKVHEFFYGDNHIKSTMVNKSGKRTYTITMSNMPAIWNDSNSPSAHLYMPHIVLDCTFKDYNDLYKWNMKMADVDCSIDGEKELMSSIVKGCKSDEEKISAIYSYVQSNVQYIAFEAGQEGFRPDRPSEILRKKYGDCKGMAMLLRTLLKAEGFDARYGIIGTTGRPYKMSEVSSICVANHAICVLYHKGRTYYLDATYKNISYNTIPGHISGKQVLVENGDQCVIETVPTQIASDAVDSLSYDLAIKNVNGHYRLEGIVKRQGTGEYREILMSNIEKSETDKKEALMRTMLDCLQTQSVWSGIKDNDDKQGEYAVEGHMTNDYNVTESDGDLYVNALMSLSYQAAPIDTFMRRHDYNMGHVCRLVRRMNIALPAGYEVKSLPRDVSIRSTNGTMTLSYVNTGKGVEVKRVLEIDKPIVRRADMDVWNADLRRTVSEASDMIVLKKSASASASNAAGTKSNKSKRRKK